MSTTTPFRSRLPLPGSPAAQLAASASRALAALQGRVAAFTPAAANAAAASSSPAAASASRIPRATLRATHPTREHSALAAAQAAPPPPPAAGAEPQQQQQQPQTQPVDEREHRLDGLPIDVWTMIARRLKLRDICRLRSTNRALRESLTLATTALDVSRVQSFASFSPALASFPSLLELAVPGNFFLHGLVRFAPRVRHLTIGGGSRVDAAAFAGLLRSLPLESLDISTAALHGRQLAEALRATQRSLIGLRIGSNSAGAHVGNDVLAAIVATMPSLRTLDIEMPALTDAGLAALSAARHLRVIALRATAKVADWAALARCPSPLEDITLGSGKQNPESLLAICAAHATTLHSLAGSAGFAVDAATYAQLLDSGVAWRRLDVCLTGSLMPLVATLRSRPEIDLSRALAVTDEFIFALVRSSRRRAPGEPAPALRRIRLNSIGDVSITCRRFALAHGVRFAFNSVA